MEINVSVNLEVLILAIVYGESWILFAVLIKSDGRYFSGEFDTTEIMKKFSNFFCNWCIFPVAKFWFWYQIGMRLTVWYLILRKFS